MRAHPRFTHPRFARARALAAGLALLALPALLPLPAAAEGFGLGRTALPQELAAWDIDIRPDGLGLPEGAGDVQTGEALFSERCAVCHGDFGEGVDRWPVLAGGQGTLADRDPVKTVGSYWPYLSTLWDYVHRAMPFTEAHSLNVDDTYAIVAYILYSNDIVDDDFTLTRENFATVEMPNADGFFVDDRDQVEVPLFSAAPCMRDCKSDVHITRRATVLDVTPETDTGTDTGTGDETASAEAPAAPPAPTGPDPVLVAAGEEVFRKCAACHRIGADARNAVGPVLNGVVGRHAGAIDDFRYSPAMKAAAEDGLVWTPELLDAYLTDPKAIVPRGRMSFAGLRRAEDRAAVIAYLRAQGG